MASSQWQQFDATSTSTKSLTSLQPKHQIDLKCATNSLQVLQSDCDFREASEYPSAHRSKEWSSLDQFLVPLDKQDFTLSVNLLVWRQTAVAYFVQIISHGTTTLRKVHLCYLVLLAQRIFEIFTVEQLLQLSPWCGISVRCWAVLKLLWFPHLWWFKQLQFPLPDSGDTRNPQS